MKTLLDSIVCNAMITPDGTVLNSNHVYDFKEHIDKNGEYYMVDGGNTYFRYSDSSKFPAKKLFFVLSDIDNNFEEIREYYSRGGRGKDGESPLVWVPISKMSNNWLHNCITYNIERGLGYCSATIMYLKELDYRNKNNILIEDENN